jgi:hypothetical protein
MQGAQEDQISPVKNGSAAETKKVMILNLMNTGFQVHILPKRPYLLQVKQYEIYHLFDNLMKVPY